MINCTNVEMTTTFADRWALQYNIQEKIRGTKKLKEEKFTILIPLASEAKSERLMLSKYQLQAHCGA